MVAEELVAAECASDYKLKSTIDLRSINTAGLELSLMMLKRSMFGRKSHVVLAVGESGTTGLFPHLALSQL